MIPPGKTLGILGGGQLGKMTAQAAHRLGYRVHVYDSAPGAPAFGVAHAHTVGAFDDGEALARFAAGCDVVTYEFENLGSAQLRALEDARILRPSARVLEICQNRLREKRWLRDNGFPHVPFAEVGDASQLEACTTAIGFPCVLKTADFGYDGKGQRKLASAADLPAAKAEVAKGGRWIVERWIDFACEVSAVVARSTSGQAEVFPIAENLHAHHILDVSVVPARVDASVLKAAGDLGTNVAAAIGAVGLLAIEMFVLGDGRVLVNELAPRPHNSGHYTIEGCLVSQFEQHVRAVCGLPLAKPVLRAPAVAMINLLGDVWSHGEPDWSVVLADANAALHLYGKKDPRPGRKMGHITVVAQSADQAVEHARRLKAELTRRK